MGEFMKEDDLYIGGLLDQLNIRFGPSVGGREWFGGIEEMALLQKEFGIFKKGRSFRDSISVLNISAGVWNARIKNRWLDLLGWLRSVDSNTPGKSGDESIVEATIQNLESSPVSPMYFTAHHAPRAPFQVIITPGASPLFYVRQTFLTISIPMRPWSPRRRTRKPGA